MLWTEHWLYSIFLRCSVDKSRHFSPRLRYVFSPLRKTVKRLSRRGSSACSNPTTTLFRSLSLTSKSAKMAGVSISAALRKSPFIGLHDPPQSFLTYPPVYPPDSALIPHHIYCRHCTPTRKTSVLTRRWSPPSSPAPRWPLQRTLCSARPTRRPRSWRNSLPARSV